MAPMRSPKTRLSAIKLTYGLTCAKEQSTSAGNQSRFSRMRRPMKLTCGLTRAFPADMIALCGCSLAPSGHAPGVRLADVTGRAERVPDGLLATPTRIRDAVTAFIGIGADEVMLCCWATDPDQANRLADAPS
ncbi:hypothetical protein ACQP2T_23790 [Nonomuraea sp. CA-143628]|uniref:hypothetical protein n=1 Tax=Nonomuraea sp. CA-143628 TaxID=3239997 RepID=UPI003D8C7B32